MSYVSFRENNILAKNSEFTVCDLLLNLWLEAISINSLYFVEIKEKTSKVTKIYTTFTNFSMKYYLMCKVYTDVGGIK